nr:Na+/H+ antiporter NhaA [Acidimicrobiia bacterium]
MLVVVFSQVDRSRARHEARGCEGQTRCDHHENIIIAVAVMLGLRRARIVWLAPYVVLGAGVWLATQASGIHATIAGVV